MRVIVSLTTIPPRFSHLPVTLESLRVQSRKPDRIIVHVPERYERFSRFSLFLRHCLRTLERSAGADVEIHSLTTDFGPATKLIGVTFNDGLADEDLIICVDDDRNYDPDLVARHVDANRNAAYSVKTETGSEIEHLSRFSYTKKLMPRGKEYAKAGYIDCLGGCCGFSLYRKHIDASLRNVPRQSLFVDDIFFSAYFTRKGIPIEVLENGKDHPRTRADAVSPLVVRGKDEVRRRQNDDAVEFFRENWNIWTDAAP